MVAHWATGVFIFLDKTQKGRNKFIFEYDSKFMGQYSRRQRHHIIMNSVLASQVYFLALYTDLIRSFLKIRSRGIPLFIMVSYICRFGKNTKPQRLEKTRKKHNNLIMQDATFRQIISLNQTYRF